MNGPHDLGGLMGFGPIKPEPDEPVFHAEWEKRPWVCRYLRPVSAPDAG